MSQTSHDQGHHGPGHTPEQDHLGEKYEGGLFSHTKLWCAFWSLQEFAMQHDGLQRHAQA